jgi:hypothetical protein
VSKPVSRAQNGGVDLIRAQIDVPPTPPDPNRPPSTPKTPPAPPTPTDEPPPEPVEDPPAESEPKPPLTVSGVVSQELFFLATGVWHPSPTQQPRYERVL